MHFLKTRFVTTTGLALIGTGSYVMYKDYRRYPRMMEHYSRGSILPPLDRNKYETIYFHREGLEGRLKEVLEPTFSNEYYLIKGEVGTGKSRVIVEVCKELIESRGSKKEGAPIYVLASQGKNFTDTLAKSVGFLFDEHINFRFFLDFILRINAMPSREDSHKLSRLLHAIEESAHRYAQENGRPVVIVIDGAGWLMKHSTGAAMLDRIQEKAKLWADANIVKLVLVTNDEETEHILQNNPSQWSRSESPIFINDLDQIDAIKFLRTPLLENIEGTPMAVQMSESQSNQIYDLVGGRIQNLLVFKRDFLDEIPFDVTVRRMKQKEREKFLGVPNTQPLVKALIAISSAKDKNIFVSQMLNICTMEDLHLLLKKNIIKVQRTSKGGKVMLESKLTETIVQDFAAGK